ncbi:class I SAM-dependent methyltransferase [Cellulomonas triticagri]|uniref:Methyltransferase domain-containing protein n=1 Tax=Cellulomonas triticagri TaxID=2483352 RepID=A0A3M2JN65_9CELL|nr:class I SAM-dependent methyltransferase [Cellulomonas triticagri]RMI13741.1 methyltransferase domain-containing protein [Cellulomonas triticagri]
MTQDLLAALRCDPETPAPDLVAVDAADRLVLDEAAPALAAAGPGEVVVVGDRYGALTLGATDRFGLRAVRAHTDRLTGEQALAANAGRLGLADAVRQHAALDPDLVAGARVVLLALPRALDALDEVAGLVAAHAAPDVVVVAGGREKHMSRSMNVVLGRHFTEVHASRGRQKARVLHASGPRPGATSIWPAATQHEDLGLTVHAHGAAFAGTRVDIGTRFLLEHLDGAVPDAGRAVDLGCGTGVLATVLARTRPGLSVVATDESAAAVASARETVAANGVADRVEVRRARGTAGLDDASVDLVVLNPPFHVGAAVLDTVAPGLFAEAARVLRPGGELWCVWNSGLGYRPCLQALVGPTRQVARGPKFTVTASTRR